MRIEIRDSGFRLEGELSTYLRLRLTSALGHLARRVERVIVCLADLRGPGGAAETRCRMLAGLVRSGEVRVQETNPDLYGAIDRAAERLAEGVGLETERRERTRLVPDLVRPRLAGSHMGGGARRGTPPFGQQGKP